MTEVIAALEPLFGPTDVPDRHRTRAKLEGSPAQIVAGRRPTPIVVAQNLRLQVAEWRQAEYAGASDTSRELLQHWFGQDHEVVGTDGRAYPFAYYFCQREAIETLIYLYECRAIRTISSLTGEFGGPGSELAALGVSPEEDAWCKYAFKVATGAGKTKVMALAIVWSYFHALREAGSPLARDFVVIAPGVTVFERLKEDFRPGTGGPDIFDRDPLIPSGWIADWNVDVVLQDEPSGATTGGTLYLTNIHRLYDPERRRKAADADTYEWMGPAVKRSIDPGEALRARITAHKRLMVLNDEAHRLWDPGNAWNEAIRFVHNVTHAAGGGVVAQLDFSATPKDSQGQIFKHVVVDTPLGEAVDAGIVKTPIIGQGERLIARPHDDAAYRYEHHLMLGYNRWQQSRDEWQRSGKKPLMFVMAENTQAADEITRRLNSDPLFSDLNGKTINLHTNLKGRLRKRGRGVTSYYEFVESEKEISDEDLKELRKLSRELDEDKSPYQCIVSVLMLREGWDVRNVTTIVPLRPLTAKSGILPEQTLGRGLRRMTPPGPDQPIETVTVVEHKSFASLYREELAQEGLPVEIVDTDKIPRTTITIYLDAENKNLAELDLEIPRLTYGYRFEANLENLSFDDVVRQFEGLAPIPLGAAKVRDIKYEGRHLITNEIVEQMRIKLPLLSDPIGAISFYREEIERSVKVRGTHAKLAPLIQRFIEQLLFDEVVALYDERVVTRLGDPDVREYLRATFIPLLLQKIIRTQERVPERKPVSVIEWRPYQASHSERHPVEQANTTPFNLVPCNRQLEVAMTHFLDRASDVHAFAKNQGPECVRVDSLTAEGRRSLYTPDFLIRKTDGKYLLAETKGRVDQDVPGKARSAIEWCKAASANGAAEWDYLYVPQVVFTQFGGDSLGELARACGPSLRNLLREADSGQMALPLQLESDEVRSTRLAQFVSLGDFQDLAMRSQRGVEHAILLFDFVASKPNAGFAPIFQPLLGPIDGAAEKLLMSRLESSVPVDPHARTGFFEPIPAASGKPNAHLIERGRVLKRLLVDRSPIMPVGVLLFCLDYRPTANESTHKIFGVVSEVFSDIRDSDLRDRLRVVYDFRNTYIAHEKGEQLTARERAEESLHQWVDVLVSLEKLAPHS
jgi:type III restriction enzyme